MAKWTCLTLWRERMRMDVHGRGTKVTRSRAPCPQWRLYLGISDRPWSFTKALGRDDLNRVWQGARDGELAGCRPSTVVILQRTPLTDKTGAIIGDASSYARRSDCCGPSGAAHRDLRKERSRPSRNGSVLQEMTEWLIDSTRSNLDGFNHTLFACQHACVIDCSACLL